MAIVCVDPIAYEAASETIGETFTQMVFDTRDSLQRALADTARVAGHDPAGASWAASYDGIAEPTLMAISDLGRAGSVTGTLLQQSGFNHALADLYSNVSGGEELPAPTAKYSIDTGGFVFVPSAAGGAVMDLPEGWELVQSAIGVMWPDGEPGKLRGMTLAWDTAADRLDSTWSTLSKGIAALEFVESPEIDSARTVCGSLGDTLSELATECRTIATSCTEMAEAIDKAREDIIHELMLMLAAIVAIEVAAIAAGAVSFGSGTVAGQFVVAAEVTAASTRIAAVIARFLEAASLTGRALATPQALVVSERMATIIAKSPKAAHAVPVGGDLAAIAEKLPSPWTLKPSPRGFAVEKIIIEKMGQKNLPPNYPGIDTMDWATGTATSIKSIDLDAKSYLSASGLKSRIKQYINDLANFNGADYSRVVIRDDMIEARSLRIGIPRAPSPEQQAAFDAMSEYAESKGIELLLEVVE